MSEGFIPGELVAVDTNTAGVPAGTAQIDIRPAVGHQWLLIAGTGFHNDAGGNKTLSWNINDGSHDVGLHSASVASGITTPVKVWPDSGIVNTPLVLTHDNYLTLYGSAIAADKFLYARYAYRKIRGAYNSA